MIARLMVERRIAPRLAPVLLSALQLVPRAPRTGVVPRRPSARRRHRPR